MSDRLHADLRPLAEAADRASVFAAAAAELLVTGVAEYKDTSQWFDTAESRLLAAASRLVRAIGFVDRLLQLEGWIDVPKARVCTREHPEGKSELKLAIAVLDSIDATARREAISVWYAPRRMLGLEEVARAADVWVQLWDIRKSEKHDAARLDRATEELSRAVYALIEAEVDEAGDAMAADHAPELPASLLESVGCDAGSPLSVRQLVARFSAVAAENESLRVRNDYLEREQKGRKS